MTIPWLRSARLASRSALLVLVLSLVLITAAEAGDVHPQSDSPTHVVAQTTERLLQALHAEEGAIRDNPERVYEIIEETAAPVMDLERTAQLVLGRHWRRASPEQQARFVREFRRLLLRTYGIALLGYTDVAIRYQPERLYADGRAAGVRAVVQPAAGPPITVEYALQHRGGVWKIYDFSVDGISLVINYRHSFANQIHNSGLSSLIEGLAAHNARHDGHREGMARNRLYD